MSDPKSDELNHVAHSSRPSSSSLDLDSLSSTDGLLSSEEENHETLTDSFDEQTTHNSEEEPSMVARKTAEKIFQSQDEHSRIQKRSSSHLFHLVEKISQEVLGKQTSDGKIKSGSTTRDLLFLENEKATNQDNEPGTRSMENQLKKVTWISQRTENKDVEKNSNDTGDRRKDGHPERLATRRKTLASFTTQRESPKYASKLEKEAFGKIRDWKAEFVQKLDNVLCNKVQETEKVDGKGRSSVINVPTGLNDEELSSLRGKIIEELRRKSCPGSLVADEGEDNKQQSKKIPTVRFSRRPSENVNPRDLQSSLLNELKRFSICRGDEAPLSPASILKQVKEKGYESADHSKQNQRPPKKTTSGNLTNGKAPLSETNVPPAPVGNVGTPFPQMFYYPPPPGMWPSMDPQRMAELLQWHCQQRKSLSEDFKCFQSSETDGEARTLFGKTNLERVLRSLQDVLDCIFTETITTLGRSEKTKLENSDTASTSMEKHTLENENVDKIFEDISSSSSSSYSSLISEIEKAALVKEEEFRNKGSEIMLDVMYEDEDFNNFIMRSLRNQNNCLEEYSSSEASVIVEEGEKYLCISDIEHGIQLREMADVSGSVKDNCDHIQIEQQQNTLYGKALGKEKWNSCDKFDDKNNVHDDNDNYIDDDNNDDADDSREKPFRETEEVYHKVSDWLADFKMTSAEKPNSHREFYKNSEGTSKEANEENKTEFTYHLFKGSNFSVDKNAVRTTNESSQIPATIHNDLEMQDLQRKSSDIFDKMLNKNSDEEETLHNTERVHFEGSGSAESFVSWALKSELSPNNSSDSNLDEFMERKEMLEDLEMMRAKDDIEELDSTDNEKFNCRRSHSIQVANVSDCPMSDMERIRIQNVFLKEELSSLQKGLSTKQKHLESKVKEIKKLQDSVEEIRNYRDLFKESRDENAAIRLRNEELRQNIEKYEKELSELRSNLDKATNKLTAMKQEMTEVCLKNDELRKQVSRISTEKQSLYQQLDKQESQYETSRQRLNCANKTLKQNYERLENEIARKNIELNRLKKEKAASTQRTKELFLELNASKGRMESKDTQISLLKSTVKDLEKENKRLKHERVSINDSICQITEEKCKTLSNANDQCSTLEKQLFARQLECKALKEEMLYWSDIWKGECKRLNDENREIQLDLESTKKENETFAEENRLVKLELESVTQHEEKNLCYISDLTSIIKKLENELESLQNHKQKLESIISKLEKEKLDQSKCFEEQEKIITFLKTKLEERQCSPSASELTPQCSELNNRALTGELLTENETLQQRTIEMKNDCKEKKELVQEIQSANKTLEDETSTVQSIENEELPNTLEEEEKNEESNLPNEQHQIERKLPETKQLNMENQGEPLIISLTKIQRENENISNLLKEDKENSITTRNMLDSISQELQTVKQLLKQQHCQFTNADAANQHLDDGKRKMQARHEQTNHSNHLKDTSLQESETQTIGKIENQLRNVQHTLKQLLDMNKGETLRETYMRSLDANEALIQKMEDVYDHYRTTKDKEIESLKSWADAEIMLRESQIESIKNKNQINEVTEMFLEELMVDLKKSLQNQENVFKMNKYLDNCLKKMYKAQKQLQANVSSLEERTINAEENADHQLALIQNIMTTSNVKLENLQKEVLKTSGIHLKTDFACMQELLLFQADQNCKLDSFLRTIFSHDFKKMLHLKDVLKDVFKMMDKKLDQMCTELHEFNQAEKEANKNSGTETGNEAEDLTIDNNLVVSKNTMFDKREDNKQENIPPCNTCQMITETKGKHIELLDRKIMELEKALKHSENVRKLEVQALREVSKREIETKKIEIACLRNAAEESLNLIKPGDVNQIWARHNESCMALDTLTNTLSDIKDNKSNIAP